MKFIKKDNFKEKEHQINLLGEKVYTQKEVYYKKQQEEKKMKINKSDYTFSNTIKAEDALEKEVEITDIKEVSTKYGEKLVAELNDDTQIFLNNLSMNNLIDAFGEETDDYLNKKLQLTIEISERTRGKKTIVLITGKETKEKKKK